jgi:hypothetical protein
MKSLVRVIALTLLASACVQAQEISLFNGRDLTGWKGLPQIWSVKDGAITGKLTNSNNPGKNTFLVWQGGEVANFELICKYKLTADNPEGRANSGVQFRASLTNSALFELQGYQAEMDPGTQAREQFPEGGGLNGCLMSEFSPSGVLARAGQKVVIHFAPPPPKGAQGLIDVIGTIAPDSVYKKLYRADDWNDYRLVAVGNHIQIFVNGQQTVDAVDEMNRASSGLIGLQIHCYNKGPKMVQFKDIKLRVITAGSTTAPSLAGSTSAPSIQTDPNQPRIEVLKDQGPNALEWALAPLDQPLPPDIRQNLTYLREDLLDEAKQKPKAGANAYTLGSQLCDKLLIAIQQRGQASVQAGYTAAQADADMRVTSQALEARRNYKMSWPQFARETSQRAEISRQQMSAAELKKEKTKVEWASRADVMRPILDGLYRQFREALR